MRSGTTPVVKQRETINTGCSIQVKSAKSHQNLPCLVRPGARISLKSVTRGQCDPRPAATFLAAGEMTASNSSFPGLTLYTTPDGISIESAVFPIVHVRYQRTTDRMNDRPTERTRNSTGENSRPFICYSAMRPDDRRVLVARRKSSSDVFCVE